MSSWSYYDFLLYLGKSLLHDAEHNDYFIASLVNALFLGAKGDYERADLTHYWSL